MIIPTSLSILRMLLTGLVVTWIFSPAFWAKVAALLVFLIASLTDFLDGYLARRWNQTSRLGALLDPVADKILVLGVLAAFVRVGLIPFWMVAVIAVREVLVTLVRLWVMRRGIALAAAAEGKQKTASQMLCLLLAFAWLILHSWPSAWGWRLAAESLLQWLVGLAMWGVVLLTVFSGVMFFWRHRVYLQRS